MHLKALSAQTSKDLNGRSLEGRRRRIHGFRRNCVFMCLPACAGSCVYMCLCRARKIATRGRRLSVNPIRGKETTQGTHVGAKRALGQPSTRHVRRYLLLSALRAPQPRNKKPRYVEKPAVIRECMEDGHHLPLPFATILLSTPRLDSNSCNKSFSLSFSALAGCQPSSSAASPSPSASFPS